MHCASLRRIISGIFATKPSQDELDRDVPDALSLVMTLGPLLSEYDTNDDICGDILSIFLCFIDSPLQGSDVGCDLFSMFTSHMADFLDSGASDAMKMRMADVLTRLVAYFFSAEDATQGMKMRMADILKELVPIMGNDRLAAEMNDKLILLHTNATAYNDKSKEDVKRHYDDTFLLINGVSIAVYLERLERESTKATPGKPSNNGGGGGARGGAGGGAAKPRRTRKQRRHQRKSRRRYVR